jgi:hypothetical protein
MTAVFVLNRAPTKSLENKTPFEAWYGTKPTVHFFRTFGCVAYVKNAGGHLRKLDDRSTPMVFIGYELGTKAYWLYNPVTDRVHVSRDVVFEEGCGWNWEQGSVKTNTYGDSDGDDPFIVENGLDATRGIGRTVRAPKRDTEHARRGSPELDTERVQRCAHTSAAGRGRCT